MAACPNAAAVLLTGARISPLGLLPQGNPDRHKCALKMVAQMNAEAFGGCTKIARMIRDHAGPIRKKQTAQGRSPSITTEPAETTEKCRGLPLM